MDQEPKNFEGRRDGVCAYCAEKAQESRDRERRERKAAEAIEALVGPGAAAASNQIPDNSQVLGSIVKQWGSVDRLAEDFKTYMDRAMQGTPKVGVLRIYFNIFDLIMRLNKDSRQENIDNMTLDQIQDEKRRMLRQEIVSMTENEKSSQLLLAMMKQQGVIPEDFEFDNISSEEEQADEPVQQRTLGGTEPERGEAGT